MIKEWWRKGAREVLCHKSLEKRDFEGMKDQQCLMTQG